MLPLKEFLFYVLWGLEHPGSFPGSKERGFHRIHCLYRGLKLLFTVESDERKGWDEMAAERCHKVSENVRLEKDLCHSAVWNFKNENIVSWLNGCFGNAHMFGIKGSCPSFSKLPIMKFLKNDVQIHEVETKIPEPASSCSCFSFPLGLVLVSQTSSPVLWFLLLAYWCLPFMAKVMKPSRGSWPCWMARFVTREGIFLNCVTLQHLDGDSSPCLHLLCLCRDWRGNIFRTLS